MFISAIEAHTIKTFKLYLQKHQKEPEAVSTQHQTASARRVKAAMPLPSIPFKSTAESRRKPQREEPPDSKHPSGRRPAALGGFGEGQGAASRCALPAGRPRKVGTGRPGGGPRVPGEPGARLPPTAAGTEPPEPRSPRSPRSACARGGGRAHLRARAAAPAAFRGTGRPWAAAATRPGRAPRPGPPCAPRRTPWPPPRRRCPLQPEPEPAPQRRGHRLPRGGRRGRRRARDTRPRPQARGAGRCAVPARLVCCSQTLGPRPQASRGPPPRRPPLAPSEPALRTEPPAQTAASAAPGAPRPGRPRPFSTCRPRALEALPGLRALTHLCVLRTTGRLPPVPERPASSRLGDAVTLGHLLFPHTVLALLEFCFSWKTPNASPPVKSCSTS